MGNIGSNHSTTRRRHTRRETTQNHPPPPPPPPQQLPELNANRYLFAAATPYPNPNTPPPPPYHSYYQYPTGAYYPPPPPLQQPYDHRVPVAGRYPVNVMNHPAPYVDHQKAVTIKNDVNIKKHTLKILPDDDDQSIGRFLVEFTFDATVSGSITLYFFAKEGEGSNMTTTKDDKMLPPITFGFKQGLGQRFKQESGTGIDLSAFEETEISKVSESQVYPLVIKAEAAVCVLEDGTTNHKSMNVQITQAVFEKDKGEYRVRVVKQILWVNGMRYELQEIYGIGNTVDGSADFDENDPGKECVICLSEPRDTTVLPCRHMCMCSGCAKLLRFQTNRCPICRQPVERLLEIKVSSEAED